LVLVFRDYDARVAFCSDLGMDGEHRYHDGKKLAAAVKLLKEKLAKYEPPPTAEASPSS
jgi:hypothetical protein